MKIDESVPVHRGREDVAVLLSSRVDGLQYVVCGVVETAHAVAVDDVDVSVLAAAEQFVRIRRAGDQNVRSRAQIRITYGQGVVILRREIVRNRQVISI